MSDAELSQRIRKVIDLGKQIFVFSTVDEENRPHSRYMGTFHSTDNYSTIFMASQTSSRKVKQLQANPHAQVLFVTPDFLETVSIAGKAYLETSNELKLEMWSKNPALASYFESAEDPEYALIRFEADVAEFMNLSETRGVAQTIPWRSRQPAGQTQKG